MTHKMNLFISEYLLSGNASDAAIKAGYSKKTAYSQGQRMLKNVEIKNMIKNHQEKVSKNAEITVLKLVTEIRIIAISSKVERNRLKAYDMLMKYIGGYINELSVIQKLSEIDLESLADKVIERLKQSYE